jgi:hypothetical protein
MSLIRWRFLYFLGFDRLDFQLLGCFHSLEAEKKTSAVSHILGCRKSLNIIELFQFLPFCKAKNVALIFSPKRRKI